MPWLEVNLLSDALLIRGIRGHYATDQSIKALAQWEEEAPSLTTEQANLGIVDYEAIHGTDESETEETMSELNLDGFVTEKPQTANEITVAMGLVVPDLAVRRLLAKGVQNGIYSSTGKTKATRYTLVNPEDRQNGDSDSERTPQVKGVPQRKPRPPKAEKRSLEDEKEEILESLSEAPVTAETLAERLRLKLSRVNAVLADLVKSETVVRERVKAVTYRLPEAPESAPDQDPDTKNENPFG